MNTSKPHLVRLDTQEIIPVDRKLTIGRHPDCDCVVTVNSQVAAVSGRHVSIEIDDAYAWIEDLGSTNGTWVRGARIAQRTPLLPGERFLLDRLEFEYRGAVQLAAASAPPVMEKTLFAGRHEAYLPPVPVPSVEDMAPKLAPAPVPLRPVPKRATPAVSRPLPAHEPVAMADKAQAQQQRSSGPLLTYIIVALGLVALVGMGLALFFAGS